MSITHDMAKEFRGVYFGGNWTAVNLKDALSGVTWQQSVTKIHDLNTIAALVFHVNYYVSAVLHVLEGRLMDAHDRYSYDLPPVTSEEGWTRLKENFFTKAEEFAQRLEQLDEGKLLEDLADPKYGSYHRNIHGLIEHAHYHLGQIILIKKILN